jgi:hypothetical protein
MLNEAAGGDSVKVDNCETLTHYRSFRHCTPHHAAP